ncbi:hypothetical protein HAX54_041011 [Datura stramonium]|uniref:Uncharacterized protein n=1 Tax=Datura stramonium TaxID=4076 RepID=A0ABS8SKU1_DATST|nr:hypothetical protein [Datura stramonium]
MDDLNLLEMYSDHRECWLVLRYFENISEKNPSTTPWKNYVVDVVAFSNACRMILLEYYVHPLFIVVGSNNFAYDWRKDVILTITTRAWTLDRDTGPRTKNGSKLTDGIYIA